MRSLAVVAFLALQLSMFTCGYDIHQHDVGGETGHIAHHQHDTGNHGDSLIDHSCHLHASHIFLEPKLYSQEKPETSLKRAFTFVSLNFKSIPYLIEHPPKSLHS